jgi:uncharacterized membrane protein YhhN
VNATVVLLLALTAVVAVVDWLAVATERRPVEYACKPLTMVGLVGVALAHDTGEGAARVAVIVALLLSLAGDVLLMVPRDLFVAGLAAFFAAHVAYVVAMVLIGAWGPGLLLGAIGVGIAVLAIGRPIVGGAARRDPGLRVPVLAYVTVISVMVAVAAGTGVALVLAGAVAFYLSDAILGWTRFVADIPRGRVAVMVTYHLGQALLVLGIL